MWRDDEVDVEVVREERILGVECLEGREEFVGGWGERDVEGGRDRTCSKAKVSR